MIQFFKLAGQSVNLFWDLTNAWLMHWGLIPHWAADPSIGNRMINARAETLTELPSFKNIVDRRRCIIPADGFYEWRKEGRSKVPMWVHLKDRKPFGFPGLWEIWRKPDGKRVESFTIITTEPNELVRLFTTGCLLS